MDGQTLPGLCFQLYARNPEAGDESLQKGRLAFVEEYGIADIAKVSYWLLVAYLNLFLFETSLRPTTCHLRP